MQILSRENAVYTFNAAHPPKYEVEDGEVHLRGLYYSERLDTYTTGEARGPAGDAAGLGRALAARLRQELEGGDGR